MTEAADKAAAKIEGVQVSRWPDRKQPIMTAYIGSRHKVIARFPSMNEARPAHP